MDDHEESTESLDLRYPSSRTRDPEPVYDDERWRDVGASRAPRQPAEGVRIIGADEAAAAIESGHVAAKMPEDAPRFGDVPPQPAGPRPELRFPGVDPRSVAKPPVAGDVLPPREERPSVDPSRPWDELLARTRSRASSRSGLFDDGPEDFFASRGEPEPPPPPEPPDERERAAQRWFDEDDDLLDAPLSPSPPPSQTVEPPSGSTPLPHWTEPPSGEVPRILPDDDQDASEGSGDDLNAWSALSARPRWRDQPTDWEDADFDDAILADEDHRVGALRAPDDDSAPFSFDELDTEPPRAAAPDDRVRARPAPGGRARISSLPTTGPSRPPQSPSGGEKSSSGDLSSRVLIGVIAAGVLLVAAAIGPSALVFLVAVLLTVAAAELYQGLRTRGYQPATLLGLVGTASLVGAVYWQGLDAYPLVLGLFVVFTLLWYLTGVVRARPTMNVAVTVLAFLYVGFLGSFAALLLTAPHDLGIGLVLGAVLATVANDIGAFFVGRWAGKTPLVPSVSPHKTVEGLVGASLATLLACLVIVRFIDPWDGGKAFWLAVVVAVAAPLGDLCESMIKRDLDVKDMGHLLRGHGGVLDRIDGLLFVMPATYYLIRLL